MRRLMNVFCNAEPRSGTLLTPPNLRRVACLVTVGGVLALTQAFAKEPAENGAQPVNKLKPANGTVSTSGTGAANSTAAGSQETPIPECLEKLKLSQTQQTKAKEVLHKYDATIDTVWKQFGAKYMETVRTEVSLLAAIEDNLTDSQRTKVREQRRKVANTEKTQEGTNSKKNAATDKPENAVEQELSGADISLTSEQEAAADKIHQQYIGHLRSLNRDIQGIHTRLVSLEADKLVELEKVLTKEQLAQLRQDRQSMTGAPKVTNADKESTKTE